MQEIIENIKFDFSPQFKITEGKTVGWIELGGTALTEGISLNKNKYTFNNLKENDGKTFKWLFGHPEEPESHIVGSGSLKLEGDKLMHSGKIRNTANHPDVTESIKDGFLGPSIHASAKKVTREGKNYVVEGLSIDGIGLVAFQGVKAATIDYAIAESFEMNESEQDENNKDKEDNKMSEEEEKSSEEEPKEVAKTEEPKKEEEVKSEEEPKAAEEEESKKEEPAEEPKESSRVSVLEKEIASLKESRKQAIVESIMKINSSLKKESLMKESEERLDLMKCYEEKLAKKGSTAIVETAEKKDMGEIVVEKNGDFTMSEKMYSEFNKELRERVR